MYRKLVKPFIDRLFALVGLIVAIPVFMLVGLIVYLFISKNIVFKQRRIGFHEQSFILYKFRSMKTGLEHLPESDRIPWVGKILRKTGLDELPQLWNVVKGDMSFVGPRPLLPEYISRYNEEQRKRHLVHPGITGLSQVLGRNKISWEERFKLDVQYVSDVSLLLDIRILALTFKEIFSNKLDGNPSAEFLPEQD